MASQPAVFNVQEFTDDGVTLVGGRLYTYAYGTTTQKVAYTDADGLVPQTYTSDGIGGLYIALNSRGELPASLYLGTGSYDLHLCRADGSTVWTRRADGVGDSGSSGDFIQAGTGAVTRTMQDKAREAVSAADFGAVGDGITNDTTAIQNAIATGKSVRLIGTSGSTFLTRNAYTCSTKGQLIYGDGRSKTLIKIDSAFNLAASGVFVGTSGEEGPQFRDFGIDFAQPDTAVRANLIAYPPAFYLVDCPRFTMQSIRIACAMTGVKMTGNSGGAFIHTLEVSAFNIHVEIDGSLDTVRLTDVHCWNFGVGTSAMTANQLTIYKDGATIGLKVGTCDDLIMEGCLFICSGPQIRMHAGTGGTGPFGTATNCDFDSFASIVCDVGQLAFSSCFFSAANANVQFINQTGGWLKFTSCEFEYGFNAVNPMMKMVANATIGTTPALQITNCLFRLGTDMIAIQGEATLGNGLIMLTNNAFYSTVDITATNPWIYAKTGCRLLAMGNRISDKGTGTGNFIKIDTDDQHVITGNSFTGWGGSFPAAPTLGMYSPNLGLPDSFTSGMMVGNEYEKRLTGSLDGSGNVTVAHSILSAQLVVVACTGYYKDVSGGAKPLTIVVVDGTNVQASGGTNGAHYRILLRYSNSSQSPW